MEVEAELHPCFACGSKLMLSTNVRADCSNPACPGGRVFAICGFCRRYSFSVAQSYCFNPNCRLYKMKRTICPICNKMSVITYHGRPICINRSCESNRKIVTNCFFCGNPSFLKSPGAMFCTKSTCPRLLQTVYECFACKQFSYVQAESKCKNPSCKYYDVEITQCSSCRNFSFIVAPEHPHSRKCMNPDCPLYYEKAETKVSTDQIRREQLGKMLQDTMSIPLEELQKAYQTTGEVQEADKEPESFDEEPVPEAILEEGPVPEMLSVESEPEGASPSVKPSEEDVTEKEKALESADEVLKPVDEAAPIQEPEPIEVAKTIPASSTIREKKGEESVGEDIAEELFKEVTEGALPKQEEETVEPLKSEERPVLQEQMVEVSEESTGKGMVKPIQKDEEWEMETGAVYTGARGESRIIAEEPAVTTGAGITIEDIYRFVDEHTLQKGDGTKNPLLLVIGLPGSGKTTYLTMLGTILMFKEQRFHFPYPGLAPGLVDVVKTARRVFGKSASTGQKRMLVKSLRNHVVDLVAGFAQENYNKYVKQRLFPPQTPPSVASSDQITGMFLITELQKGGRSIARIATLEISGEDVKEVLKQIRETEPEKVLQTPEQRVFYKMLNRASGFIILIDPASSDNDAIYNNFFWVLEEVLLKRFKERLYELVLKRLKKDRTRSMTERLELDDVIKIIEQAEVEQKQIEIVAAERERIKEQYRAQLKDVLKDVEESGAKVTMSSKWKNFLSELDSQLFKVAFGEQRKQWHNLLGEKLKDCKTPQHKISLLAEYLISVVKYCLKHVDELIERQPEEVVRRLNEQMQRAEVERAVKEVFEEYGIPLDFDFHITTSKSGEETLDTERFANLKYISLAITKSDMNRIVYPPENFAHQKLPLSDMHLKKIQEYLKLFGGYVRYYNASVAGYSIMMDTTGYLGPECTLTPINVLEPVFDMLESEGII